MRLRGEGIPFKRLPDAFHGNRWFYWAEALADEQTRLFHAIKFFRLGEKMRPLDILAELDLYEQYLLKGVQQRGLVGKGKRLLAQVRGAEDSLAASAVKRLYGRLRALCDKYVLPAVRARSSAAR